MEERESRRKKMAAEDDEKVKIEAAKIIDVFPTLPRLVVFDLDYTLCPFYCDFRDEDDTLSLFPQARGILYALKDRGIELAIASRSPTSNVAKAFLNKLGIDSLFVVQLKRQDRPLPEFVTPFHSMLFFDDEYRNIEGVSKMGVTSICVDRGLTLQALGQGLAKFSQKSGFMG